MGSQTSQFTAQSSFVHPLRSGKAPSFVYHKWNFLLSLQIPWLADCPHGAHKNSRQPALAVGHKPCCYSNRHWMGLSMNPQKPGDAE